MRHGILIKLVSGEAGSVSVEDIRPWLDVTLPELVSQYKWEDIYNVDETGVFYNVYIVTACTVCTLLITLLVCKYLAL